MEKKFLFFQFSFLRTQTKGVHQRESGAICLDCIIFTTCSHCVEVWKYVDIRQHSATSLPFEYKESWQRSDGPDEKGWSSWSTWTTCSRSCDGGITYSLRKCTKNIGCQGEAVRRKICNMQSCPEPNDFRATQCSAYDELPYRGRMYKWLPFHDPDDPCSLTCQAEVYNFVVKLSPKVQDGTRCREGALDMCVNGQCQPVGCDLNVGSNKKIDECGVCGGDGSRCKRPAFVWAEREFQPCSVSCGGGIQKSEPVCRNKDSAKEVDERLCDLSIKPRTKEVSCNTNPCPVVWVAEDWGPCSVSCGTGVQTRSVFCAQGGPNGTRIQVKTEFCPRFKPVTERSCTVHDCPRWFEGAWSPCSMTCGRGFQTRVVVCRDTRGQYSEQCDSTAMPISQRFCDTGVECLPPIAYYNATVYLPGLPSQGSIEDPLPDTSSEPSVVPTTATATTPKAIDVLVKATTVTPTLQKLPRFFAEPWGPCSVTCGEGIRQRTVQCKIFLQFSKSIAQLPDSECTGKKPKDMETCSVKCPSSSFPRKTIPHPGSHSFEVTEVSTRPPAYIWRISSSFTPCTASCLGGIQRTTVHCIRTAEDTETHPRLCDVNKKPNVTVQTCNDFPCPFRWNVSAFGPCSKTCGGGKKTREVNCVQEVLRGKSRILKEVHISQCATPIPKSQEFCNVIDCPPKWRAEPWSKCSATCGGGFQSRKLRCEKELALGQIVELPPSKCVGSRPKASKKCNKKPCALSKTSTITKFTFSSPVPKVTSPRPGALFATPSSVHQTPKLTADWTNTLDETTPPTTPLTIVQQLPSRRVSVKAEGRVVVFKGSTVKVHCPNNEPNKTRVLWFKGQRRLFSGPRTTISSRGALRIRKITFADSGTYTCLIGPSKSDVTVDVKPLPLGYTQSLDDGDVMIDNPSEVSSYRYLNKNLTTSNRHQFDMTDQNVFSLLQMGKETTKRPLFDEEIKQHNVTSSEDLRNLQFRNSDKEKIDIISTHNRDKGTAELTSEKFKYNVAAAFASLDQHEDSPTLNAQFPKLLNITRNVTGSRSSTASTLPQVRHFLVNMRHFKDHYGVQGSNYKINTENSADNLEFEWIITAWSECSQTCGGDGVQVRSSQCLVKHRDTIRLVSSALCVDGGLEEPVTIQRCGSPQCPQWNMGEWSECSELKCVSWNSAYQKRDVQCQYPNGTITSFSACNEQTRPRRKQECFHSFCKGIWRIGEWSKCTARCGKSGVRTRMVQCVWYGSRLPAGNACKYLRYTPTTISTCDMQPCEKESECLDYLSYCDVIKKSNLCRMSHFRLQCCASCTAGITETSL